MPESATNTVHLWRARFENENQAESCRARRAEIWKSVLTMFSSSFSFSAPWTVECNYSFWCDVICFSKFLAYQSLRERYTGTLRKLLACDHIAAPHLSAKNDADEELYLRKTIEVVSVMFQHSQTYR